MARITVEDCLKKIDSQYELVLLAKERTLQLNAGEPALVPKDNDKNTVISLREIGEGKVSIKTLEDSAITKLRKQQEETTELEELDGENEDNFDKIYKGEISKSGIAILPSKRVRKITDKLNLRNSKEEESTNSEETDLKDEDIDETDKVEADKASE